MAKDTKKSIELKKKLSESQTVISIGDRKFILNEMAIKQVKDFALKVVTTMDLIQEQTGVDITKMELEDLIGHYGDKIFNEVTELFNWIFAYKNDDYVPASVDWVGENISIRIATEIVKEIAVQNKLDWLGPFFRGKIMGALKVALR